MFRLKGLMGFLAQVAAQVVAQVGTTVGAAEPARRAPASSGTPTSGIRVLLRMASTVP
ncbi:hypothetical protein [Streptomyces hygroscopicus]|uniref:hypothetical protein n=1 Tax=Streptomyces hygroscopicus TaxID=1912 RepID=UPI000A5FFAD7|nr:hypothetical protein [Streptomyces hygroscopicus]